MSEKTYAVMMEMTPPGDPSTWSEGDDQPKVVSSGLTYEAAHFEKQQLESALLDDEPDCDRCEIDEIDGDLICGPDCCKGRGTSYAVYVEEETAGQDEFLKLARAT